VEDHVAALARALEPFPVAHVAHDQLDSVARQVVGTAAGQVVIRPHGIPPLE
jgi:hypothetical protein